jgi:hypothetical protein
MTGTDEGTPARMACDQATGEGDNMTSGTRILKAAKRPTLPLLAFFLILPLALRAVEYHVSPSGDDAAPGTRGAPWRTIQKAADAMGPGDIVRIAAGVYREPVRTVRAGNPDDGAVVFAAAGDGIPILDGSGVHAETGFTIEHDHIKLSGLEIRNWSGTGIWISGAGHVTVEECEVHQVPYGIGVANGAHDFVLRKVRIHHFDLYGFDASPSGGEDCTNGTFEDCVAHTGRDPDQNVDGFALGHGGQYGFLFLRCETYEVFDGFDISSRNTTMDKCSAHDCWNGGYKLWQDGIVLSNCVAYDNRETNVELDWDKSPGTVSLVNCTFVGSGTFNVWVENSGDSLRMFNCILVGGENIGLAFEQSGITNYRGDYNIFHNRDPERAVVVAYEDEFSLARLAGGAWTQASGQDRHSLAVKDPETELFVNPRGGDFSLRPGSPAIDSGTSENAPRDDFLGTMRPAGSGFDIGAFEWVRRMIPMMPATAAKEPWR